MTYETAVPSTAAINALAGTNGYRVLSTFSGAGSGSLQRCLAGQIPQAQLLCRLDPVVENAVACRAQDPHIGRRRVLSGTPSAESRHLMSQLHDTALTAGLTGFVDPRVANEKAGADAQPPSQGSLGIAERPGTANSCGSRTFFSPFVTGGLGLPGADPGALIGTVMEANPSAFADLCRELLTTLSAGATILSANLGTQAYKSITFLRAAFCPAPFVFEFLAAALAFLAAFWWWIDLALGSGALAILFLFTFAVASVLVNSEVWVSSSAMNTLAFTFSGASSLTYRHSRSFYCLSMDNVT